MKEIPMIAFVWWMLIGLGAGLLARLLVPGPQPMGWLYTMLLGMVGSIIGGFIASSLFGYPPDDTRIHADGLFIATGGAMLLLVIALNLNRTSRSPGPRL